MSRAKAWCLGLLSIAGAVIVGWAGALCVSHWAVSRPTGLIGEMNTFVGKEYVFNHTLCIATDEEGGVFAPEFLTAPEDDPRLPKSVEEFRTMQNPPAGLIDVLPSGTQFRILDVLSVEKEGAGRFEMFRVRILAGRYKNREFKIFHLDLLERDILGNWQLRPYVVPVSPEKSAGP